MYLQNRTPVHADSDSDSPPRKKCRMSPCPYDVKTTQADITGGGHDTDDEVSSW